MFELLVIPFWNVLEHLQAYSPLRSAMYFIRPSAKEKGKNNETVVEIEADELAYT